MEARTAAREAKEMHAQALSDRMASGVGTYHIQQNSAPLTCLFPVPCVNERLFLCFWCYSEK